MSITDRALSLEAAIKAENASRIAANVFASKKQELISENQVAVLKKMGFTNGEQVSYFNAEIESNPKLKDMFAGFEKDFATTNKYDAVLKKIGTQVLTDGAKVKFDTDVAKKSGTGIIDKLAKDLNGTSGPQMVKQLRDHPDTIGAKIDDYAAGRLEVAALLAEPVVATSPAAPTATSGPATPAPAAKKATAKATAAVAAPAPVEPATAIPPAPAANAPAPAAMPTPDPTEQVLTALAGASDKEIKSDLTKTDVKRILTGMSDQASAKFGVSAATAEGFKKRIETDPALLAQITTNLQNNPEFVRQLAKAGKDKAPLDKTMQDMARPIMTDVMENPENLADDKYVKNLSQKMNMGSTMGGFGKLLSSVFGEGFGGKISGWFNAIFQQIKTFFSGFTGDKSVLSMSSNGKSMFPSLMINLDAMNANRDAAAAQARYNPGQMTAFSPAGPDGKFVHNGAPITDKDGKQVVKNGKPVFEEIPNGQINLKTADGKDVKVIPSVGVLTAKQMPGSYDQNGQYVRGNIQVPVVTGVNEYGASNQISTVVLTPAQFDEYKKLADAEAKKKGGSIQELAFESYTEADAAERASKGRVVQMATVNPKTGEASPVTAVNIGAPQEANPSVGYTVANGTVMRKAPATNDPQYELQGNG